MGYYHQSYGDEDLGGVSNKALHNIPVKATTDQSFPAMRNKRDPYFADLDESGKRVRFWHVIAQAWIVRHADKVGYRDFNSMPPQDRDRVSRFCDRVLNRRSVQNDEREVRSVSVYTDTGFGKREV